MSQYMPTGIAEGLPESARSKTAQRLLGIGLVVVIAEFSVLLGRMPLGLAIHAVALLGILWLVFVTDEVVVAYEAMLFLPLLRLLNLGTGSVGLHPYLWLAFVYVMILGGMALVLADREFTAASIGVWPPPSGRARRYLLVGIAAGILFGSAQWALELESSPVEVTPPNALLAVLVVGLLVGFVEELLFRGILQPATADILGTPAAIVLVSVIFGFMHSVWMEPLNVVFAFFVSLYLGWEYARTRNFWHIWIVHAMINIIAYAVLPLWLGG